MRVLVACELSGVVRESFRRKGHDAWSCDILPADDGGPHYCDDIANVLAYTGPWDLMIAHPPCTYLSVSGCRWLYYKDGSINEDRWRKMEESLNFVRMLLNADIDKIALENPVSVISSRIRKPDQTIHPYYFGDPASKKTCLWLKNLPKLEPTNIVEPEKVTTKSGRQWDRWWYESSCISNLEERAKFRSKTFQGIAEAMAEQWG